MRHIGCSIAMSNLILNPTVQEVIDMCMKSNSAGNGLNQANGLYPKVARDIGPPAPFSLLGELIEGMEGSLSLDFILTDVTKQTELQLDHLDDVLPLSPEAKWFQNQTLTTKWGLEDTAASFVTMGAPIQDSVDIQRLKSAFADAAKVEPVSENTVPTYTFALSRDTDGLLVWTQLPRTYLAKLPSSNEWLQVIAKPNVAALNWEQWSASSKQAMLERLQQEHDALRYIPGCRASVSKVSESPTHQRRPLWADIIDLSCLSNRSTCSSATPTSRARHVEDYTLLIATS